MGFRLLFLAYMVASASCFQLHPESHANINNCPIVSGSSILKHLDIDNAGVERLVVYFYKAKNSHQIIPFIPSREYQECIEDVALEAGETVYNTLNVVTIQGLFERSRDRTIRYVTKPPFVVTESPVNVWAQPWDIYQHHGPHELSTYTTGETRQKISLDLPEHGHDSPNYAPIVHGIDADKRPDWHIAVQDPDDHTLPWQPDRAMNTLLEEIGLSTTYVTSENDVSIASPDRDKSQNLDVNIIEPLQTDANLKLITNEHNEVPAIRPDEHPLIGSISPDTLRPVRRPIENNIIIRPHHPDDNNRPDIIKEEIEAPVENNIIIEPNRPHDQYQPIIEEAVEAPVIKPIENNIIMEPNRPHDQYRPVIEEAVEAPVIKQIENNIIIEPNRPHDQYRPIIEEAVEAPVIKPIENNIIIEPNRPHDQYRPIIGEAVEAPVIKPIENNIIIEPNRPHDQYRPIIGEAVEAPVIKPIENSIIIEPNRPHDQYRPIIGEEIEAPVVKPIENNLIIRPHQPGEKLPWIISDNIEAPVIRSKDRPFPYLPNTDEIQYQSSLEHLSGNNDYNDYGSREVNGQLNIGGENIKSFIIPKGDHGNIIHGDTEESLNSQNEEEINALLSQKHHLKKPSEETDKLNLIYKWSKVKVPRVDSSGKVYGWMWKSVRSPVRSKSVKWSYYESSRGKKHRSTHWKHKSSKIYHHTTKGDISVVNFDAWLKKQIRNMRNNGNMIPLSDDYIYTVKIAIEKALKTNGIRVKKGGVLIDAKGNVLRLDNIELRPIYIGRSLVYDRILKNSAKSINYKIPANTPFLEGLLVSVINPPRSIGIVPLGVTALPRVKSHQALNVFAGSGRKLRPISIKEGLHKLITGKIHGVDEISPGPHLPPKILVDDSTSLSEEQPEYRIIGGSFAVGSGSPLANKGRSGRD